MSRSQRQRVAFVLGVGAGDGPARALVERLRAAKIRVGFDERGSGVDFRNQIKDASLLKVNYMALIGRREAEAGTVTLRARGSEKQQATMSADEVIAKLEAEIATRSM